MNLSMAHNGRLKDINKALILIDEWDKLVAEFLAEDMASETAKAAMADEKVYNEFTQTWRSGKNIEVIEHWPPQVVIGKQVGDELEIARFEDDRIQVRLVEITCKYMPSNPTGLYNLSLPSKLYRTKQYEFISYA